MKCVADVVHAKANQVGIDPLRPFDFPESCHFVFKKSDAIYPYRFTDAS